MSNVITYFLKSLNDYKNELILGGEYTEKELIQINNGIAAICKQLNGTEDEIVMLNVHDQLDVKQVIASPINLGDYFDSDELDEYQNKKENEIQIWKDEVWECSPGSNQIYSFEFDGIPMCEWSGSNWDFFYVFVNSKNL